MSTTKTTATTDTTATATDAEATRPDDATTPEQPTSAESLATPDEPAETEGEDNGNKEAAKYRRKLRETEAERDGLRTQLEALQRQSVESIAGEVLAKPESLWAAGVVLADLTGDGGSIDRDKVHEAARTAQQDLGLMPVRRRPKPNPAQAMTEEMFTRPGFGQAFAPRSSS